jgi:hypothetical protein
VLEGDVTRPTVPVGVDYPDETANRASGGLGWRVDQAHHVLGVDVAVCGGYREQDRGRRKESCVSTTFDVTCEARGQPWIWRRKKQNT